jgi:hypothetical protein
MNISTPDFLLGERVFAPAFGQTIRGWPFFFHGAAPSIVSLRHPAILIIPSRRLFSREPDNFAKRCLGLELHELLQLFDQWFAAAHVVKAGRISLVVRNQFNL